MIDIDEIRRANLRRLEASYSGPAEAAAAVGMSTAQFINLRDGAKDSKTGKPRGMRKDTARRIERAAGKLEGWLDAPTPTTPALSDAGETGQSNVSKGPDLPPHLSALLDAARPLADGDVKLLTQIARRMVVAPMPPAESADFQPPVSRMLKNTA